jgi:ATP-dependent helicase HrpB
MSLQNKLPIDDILPQLKQALAGRDAVVLQAPPGAGKTTRVPPALLAEPWLAGRAILMLEPRRLAATNAARYMAAGFGEKVGGTVGYTIRFESRISAATRIEVVTEGILTRRLQADPSLEGVGLVIFDEFHERSLHSDLALAFCRDAQLGLREDLKLLVMSATLDAGPVARLLGDAPLVTATGRSFPVDIHYLTHEPKGHVIDTAAAAVHRALRETAGDILVFLPGAGEIRRCQERLEQEPGADNPLLCPLYGDLPFAEQERAILPGTRRKVVLATNIAETSLTIEGVRVVVDSGFARQLRFDPAAGISRLELARISAASAEQRAGRAGRLGPGVCYRLWTEGNQGGLLPFTSPEIRSADLSSLALDLARWGAEADNLVWLDPPPEGALAGARRLLRLLGALDERGRITAIGEEMAVLPAHPRLARLLLEGRGAGSVALASDLAALLAERDIFRGNREPHQRSDSDLVDRLETLHRWRDCRQTTDADPAACAAVDRAARQFREMIQGRGAACRALGEIDADTIGRLLARAYPDRIALEREPGSGRYLLTNGRGGQLSRRSAVHAEPWLVAVVLAGRRQGEGAIHMASALGEDMIRELFGREIAWQKVIAWDEREERVMAREEERLGVLVLSARPAAATPEETAVALFDGLRRLGLEVLNWSPPARQFVGRVRLMARTFPKESWPDLSPEQLLDNAEEWLGPFLGGLKSRTDLGRIDLVPPLRSLLSGTQQQRLEKAAPTHVVVPSGSRIPIDYTAEWPVMSVKLQEMFGLAETPRIAEGRVPVLLHLLSPARRPIQVTRDLKSFWDSIYPEVKKELKGRYPKHPWPEDPWNAEPTGRTKRR